MHISSRPRQHAEVHHLQSQCICGRLSRRNQGMPALAVTPGGVSWADRLGGCERHELGAPLLQSKLAHVQQHIQTSMSLQHTPSVPSQILRANKSVFHTVNMSMVHPWLWMLLANHGHDQHTS